MDLKALLLEAKQKVPPVLQVLHCGDETMLEIGGERARLQTGNFCGADGGTRAAGSAPVARGVAWSDPVPPVTGERGCAFCGGLGHRITDCPKLEAMQTKQVSNIGRKDYLAHSSMDF